MKADSFAPPGLSGEVRGWGRADVFEVVEATEDGAGERRKPPPAACEEDIVMLRAGKEEII